MQQVTRKRLESKQFTVWVWNTPLLYAEIDLSLFIYFCEIMSTVWVKKSIPLRFSDIFSNGWEFFKQFLHTYYTFLSTLDYTFVFNYLQLWLSYAILSATTQFTSYAQCPPSAEMHALGRLRKSSIALLIVVCGKSSQICCSALFSSGLVFGFDWSLWNAWSITHHTW